MKKYKFDRLMELNPTIYTTIVNSLGQKVKLAEHPLNGDMDAVIAIFEEDRLAFDTGFFDTDDMEEEDGDYVPHLIEGNLVFGWELK